MIDGHVKDVSFYKTYATNVRTENFRLMFLVMVLNTLDILSGDISTAYLNALTEEKIYIHSIPKFVEKKSMIIK